MKILERQKLSSYTYYKIGGPAEFFCQPESLDDLKLISDFIAKKKLTFRFLGAGSNVLIDDEGLTGLTIQTSKLDQTLLQTEDTVEVGAGVMVIHLLRHCMKTGLGGFDFLVGIPGSIGGVVYMNAGTKSGEAADKLFEVMTYDLNSGVLKTYSKKDLLYRYREQLFIRSKSEIILRAKFQGRHSDALTVQNEIQGLLNARKRAQPIEKPSCGSVFKNPDPKFKKHAWQLIDEAGMRGFKVGNAQVSEQHTNFIVNLGGAKASDVRAIISEVKKRVFDQSGIDLEEEVQIWSG